jgi:hypothetical protein
MGNVHGFACSDLGDLQPRWPDMVGIFGGSSRSAFPHCRAVGHLRRRHLRVEKPTEALLEYATRKGRSVSTRRGARE